MIAVVVAAAYLMGSVPFGLIVGRLMKGVDLRETGSGNIGAANAFRTLGPVGGVLVLLLDLLKGLVPVLLAAKFVDAPGGVALLQVLAGLAAIIGHNNSIFLGGK